MVTLEALSVVTVIILQAVLGVLLLRASPAVEVLGWPLLAALLGYLLADVATGFVHWFCDTFYEEDTPFVGAWLIAPFREHHRDPLAMTRHGFLELAGNSCFVLAPILLVAASFGPLLNAEWSSAFYAFTLSFTWFAAATNLFHRWAHEPAPPQIIAFLQKCGVILPAAHHAQHHVPPHCFAYCVTSGWANAFLDRIGFFVTAGRALSALGIPRSTS